MEEALAVSEEAVRNAERASPAGILQLRPLQAMAQARAGDVDGARTILRRVKARVEAEGTGRERAAFVYSQGEVELESGNFDQAIALFAKAAQIDKRYYRYWSEHGLARVYVMSGRFNDAVPILAREVSSIQSVRTWTPFHHVEAHLLLAEAQAALDHPDEARRHYQYVLDYLKDADAGHPDVEAARKGLAALSS